MLERSGREAEEGSHARTGALHLVVVDADPPETVERSCTCTCTAYGAGSWNDTAETTRDRENSIGFAARARVCCFVPFSAVSVACFDSNSHELACRRLVPSSAQQVGRGGVSGRINSPHGPTLRTRQAGSWNVAEERWKRDSWSIFAR